MLSKLIFFIILFVTYSNANSTLNDTYYIDSDDIYISTLIKDTKKDKILYKISPKKHIKRVKTKELIQTLQKHGYQNINSKSRYIKFVKNSPIDTSKIESYLENYYKGVYLQIDIKNIKVRPRSYTNSLAPGYTIKIRNKSYLSKKGVISVSTPQNKKIFFDYIIDADVLVYYSRNKIKKDTPLSGINATRKTVPLERFMAKPIQYTKSYTLQAKHTIQQNRVITTRDISGLNLIKANSNVNVYLNSNNISISFSAKALQSGRINDIITVKQANGKKIKVRVIGKNKAEMK